MLKPLGNLSFSRIMTWRRLIKNALVLAHEKHYEPQVISQNLQRNGKHDPKVAQSKRPDNKLGHAQPYWTKF